MLSSDTTTSPSKQPLPKHKVKSKSSLSAYQKQHLSDVDTNLYEIFTFYASVYNHLNVQKNATFQDKQNSTKILNLQSFLLFTKQFDLRKILKLDDIKMLFKKYSQFGKYLVLQDFKEILERISFLQETKMYFDLNRDPSLSFLQIANQKENLYKFLDLYDPTKYRLKMKTISLPFQMRYEKYSEIPNLINSRRFSLPSLSKKQSIIIPVDHLKNKKVQIEKTNEKTKEYQSINNRKILNVSTKIKNHSPRKRIENPQNKGEQHQLINFKNSQKNSIFTKISNIQGQIDNKLKQMIIQDSEDQIFSKGQPSKVVNHRSIQSRIDELLRQQQQEQLKILKKIVVQKKQKKN